MVLIEDGKLVEDVWVSVADDADLPANDPAIVSLDKWLQDRERLGRRNAPLGVRLKAGQSPDLIADDLGRFDVIALEFPIFTDGRAYSYARTLRERYAYAGQVRAVGNVLRDQYTFMRRCGFDAFEVADGTRLEDWLESDREISVVYQQAIDGRPPAAALRAEKS